jgi:hypothetical protein
MVNHQTLEHASEEYLLLRAYVSEQPPGTWLGYDEVEAATGVPLGSRENRDKLRRAIEALDIDSLVEPGKGYWIADVTAMDAVLARKLGRVSSADTSYGKSVSRFEKFIEAMTPDQLHRYVHHKSSRSAIRQSVALAEKVYSKPPPEINNSAPVILPKGL